MSEDEFRAAVAAAISRHDELLAQLATAVQEIGELCLWMHALTLEQELPAERPDLPN